MAEIKEFKENLYCESGQLGKATSGKDILLCIWSADGSKLLAIGGQQGLTINREKEVIEINSKTIDGGWKNKVAGVKDWSIEVDGMYADSDESQKLLAKAFEDDEYVCLKVVNAKSNKALFGGLAIVKEFNCEAPFDDSMTFEMTLEGCGKLTDMSTKVVDAPQMPEGFKPATGVGK